MAALISIALCTYNPGKFLVPLLDSLLAQTWRPFEIICVDDASTDETISMLRKYERNNPGIFKLFFNESNLGYIKNFEKCISLCSGDFIAIADHDEIWLPVKLRTLHDAIGKSMMVYSDSTLINEAGVLLNRKLSDMFKLHDNPPPQAFAFYDFIWGHTMLFRKELLRAALPVPPEMPYDTWLGYTAASVSTIRYVDQPLTKWRQHPEAFSNRMFKINQDRKKRSNWRQSEYHKKRDRIRTLAAHNEGDKSFMRELLDRYSELENKFSWNLFFFLNKHRKKLFPIWRRNHISQLNEFRKMSRRVQ